MPYETAEGRLAIYRKVMTEEFIREFNFLADVMAGRATAKADFTDKIIEIMGSCFNILLNAAPIPNASIVLITETISLGVNWINCERKMINPQAVSQLQAENEPEAMRVLLESVALEASRRYEFVIATKLSVIPNEAVIPFAKAGVERMLEYVARHGLPLQANYLLEGLLLGRSGAYVSGFFNTRLIGQDKKTIYTAEGVYSRSGFMTSDEQYWVANKSPTVNVKPLLQNASDLVPAAIKGFRRSKVDLAAIAKAKHLTVKFDKNNPTDPKYGYVMMYASLIDVYFGANKQAQSIARLSTSLQQVLRNHQWYYQSIKRKDIENYLKSDKKIPFIAYLKKNGYPQIQIPTYEAFDRRGLDFSRCDFEGADFSDCILNGIIASENINNTKFDNCYLFGADFSKVKTARGASFQHTHAEYLKANNANLAYADFTDAQLAYADFTGANLTDIQYLGANFVGAKLQKLQMKDKQNENQLKALQQQQIKIIEKQQQELKNLEKELKTQHQEFKQLKAMVINLEQQLDKLQIASTPLQQTQAGKLQKFLADLMQEKQTRETFTRYCQTELKDLEQKATSNQIQDNHRKDVVKKLQEQLNHTHSGASQLQSLLIDIDSALKNLANLESKQQQHDEAIQRLDQRVDAYVSCQQVIIQQVTKGLANVQEEVERFKYEIRQALREQVLVQDKVNTTLERRLAQLEEIVKRHSLMPNSFIPFKERQNIFDQQFSSLVTQMVSLQVAQPQTQSPLDEKYTISSTQLIFEQKLAEGSFAKVYLGRRYEQQVAIKILEGQLTQAEQKEFIREVKIMSRLRHSNIVQFYGACLESNKACLIMEYMDKGSLQQYLQQTKLKPEQQKQLAIDVLKGLIYLHSEKVLHRDLKSGNILLNRHFEAKISDFGLSKTAFSSISDIHKQTHDIAWQAPEVLNRETYTEQSDIYSCGIILWEIFTQLQPYANLSPAEIEKNITANQLNPIPEIIPDIIHKLILCCWQKEPFQRPSLNTILKNLEAYQPPRPSSPSPNEYFDKGFEAEKAKDFIQAKTFYEKAAERGHAKAPSYLGTIFLKGLGKIPQDKARAYQLFLKGANNGHVRAMYNLAVMLEKGDGITKDISMAIYWYEQAGLHGDKEALEIVQKLRARMQQPVRTPTT